MEICDRLGLSGEQCRILEDYVAELCGRAKREKAVGRKRSRWQECIAERRKGQRFDPEAIKRLAEEYRAGRCP